MAHKSDQTVFNPEPVCKPLDTYDDIISFIQNPPSWRSLCKEITPHSKDKIRNMSMNTLVGVMGPDRPPTFCHFNPESEDVERQSADTLPKTLVCHDMANGYHDDSKIDGTNNHMAYSFYHWAGIDIFCYFSHHLVTIPPVGWINVGHAHGVKVIGTVITEWAEGCDFWEFMLSEESQYQELANALVSIAKLLKFDGWLLNVENKISKPLVLVDFVKYFHQKLHAELEDPVLIWYDSVTIKGNLNWQNALNDHNKDFFDACDGFFTNYSWKESDVASSAELAGDRLADLFIGIDVWGRNFYGGGQFNTAEAVELASGYGCSLAIFAPAWTHEAAARREADIALGSRLDGAQQRRLRERALWGSLWPYLHTRLPCALPFQTSFCRGGGLKRRLYGEVLSPGPWYNLRHMQYQPNSAYGPHGYLLSTPERITAVSRHMISRDKKGIIKYQPAFELSRLELHAVRSARQLELMSRPHHDSLVLDAQDIRRAHDDDRKHFMKDVFRHIFRRKSRRRSKDSQDEPHNSHDKTHDHAHDKALDKTHEESHEKTEDKNHVESDDEPHDKTRGESHDKSEDKNHVESDVEPHGKTAESHDKSEDKNHVESVVESHDKTAESQEGLHDAHAHSAHSWHDVKSGWSMRQMSVNIKLGSQPAKRLALACVPGELPCLEPYYLDSYIGGSSLIVHPSDQLSPEHRWSRLLHCEFPCAGQLVACVVTKTLPDCDHQYLNVKLFARDPSEQELRVSLVGRQLPGAGPAPDTLSASRALSVYPLADGPALRTLQVYLLLHQPGFYMSTENSFGWKVRYYIVPLGSAVVTSINLHCGLGSGPILLGHIGLCLRREEVEDASTRTDEEPRVRLPAANQYTNPGPAGGTLAPGSRHTIKTLETESPYTFSPRDSRGDDTPRNSLILQNLDKPWPREDDDIHDFGTPSSKRFLRTVQTQPDLDTSHNDWRGSKDIDTSGTDLRRSSEDMKTRNMSFRSLETLETKKRDSETSENDSRDVNTQNVSSGSKLRDIEAIENDPRRILKDSKTSASEFPRSSQDLKTRESMSPISSRESKLTLERSKTPANSDVLERPGSPKATNVSSSLSTTGQTEPEVSKAPKT